MDRSKTEILQPYRSQKLAIKIEIINIPKHLGGKRGVLRVAP